MVTTVTVNPSLDRTVVVERLEDDRRVFASGGQVDIGGKGVNVTKALASLGVSSRALVGLGGQRGSVFRSMARKAGLKLAECRLCGETRENLTLQSLKPARTYKINERGPRYLPEERKAFEAQVARLAGSSRWMVLGGALAPGLPEDFYRTLAELALETGAKVVVDAEKPQLEPVFRCRPFLIKPNEHEFAELTGVVVRRPRDVVAPGRRLVRRGITQVLVSLGAQGCVLVTADLCLHARGPKVRVRSTIGAGDSCLAGYVAALDRNATPEEALRHAVATGTGTVTRDGSAVATAADVRRNLGLVKVERLA